MQVYRLTGVDPEPVVKTLQEIGNLDPIYPAASRQEKQSDYCLCPIGRSRHNSLGGGKTQRQ